MMRRRYLKRVLLTALMPACFSVIACAIKPGAEILNAETKISVEDNTLVKKEFRKIRVLNRDGADYSNIEISFTDEVKIKNLYAAIEDREGNVIKKLKKKDIREKDNLFDTFHDDGHILTFSLKGDSYPYILAYSWETRYNNFINLCHWNPLNDRNIPVHVARLSIEVPNNYNIHYSFRHCDSFEIDSSGTRKIYNWTASGENNIREELYSPPLDRFLPAVDVVPENFIFENEGSLKKWEDFGSWINGLSKGLDQLPPEEENKILQLVKNEDDDLDKVKVLYHYLQDETRYINVMMGTGTLKPHSATYVARNKFGDCKALTNYFRSVLAFAGINSYYTLVMAGNRIEKVDTAFPSNQFNHAILFVPLKEDSIWLDCTSDGPFGYLGTFTQNRMALITGDKGNYFLRTPALAPNEVTETRKVTFNHNSGDLAKAKFINSCKGYNFELVKMVLDLPSQSDRLSLLHKYFIEPEFDPGPVKIKIPDRDSTVIEYSYTAQTSHFYHSYGNDIVINILAFDIPRFESTTERMLPVQLDYPLNFRDDIDYEIPAGYSLTSLPENFSLTSQYGTYVVNFQLDGNTVIVNKQLIINAGTYSTDEYKDFFDFVHTVYRKENSNHIVTAKNE